MKKHILLSVLLALTGLSSAFATIRIVDINGGGQYTTIQAGINAAANNDTVLVWPGTYNGQITLQKSIVLMGSGYENTIISSNSNPTIIMNSGKLEYFRITSLAGCGIQIQGGIVSNCVVISCSSHGIFCNGGTDSKVLNTVILYNGEQGIYCNPSGFLYAINCISRLNTGYGFNGDQYDNRINISYSNGSRYATVNNQGCIDIDPAFPSQFDFHVTQGTPCWDTGHPALKDPDGTRSDMGYFGGPDAPICPVVYEITTSPNGNNIDIQAKARANY
ncbi:MAG: hypothetical protein JXA03_06985 [Bacteroidales bacterium]|nr:hypothetical protein [Bacteroidales bacterium]